MAEELKIFQDVPDFIDETWTHVALLGGMTEGAYDTFQIARNYKTAGDVLIEKGLHTEEPCDLIYPILFIYRHAIELYLKAILKPKRLNHKLSELLSALDQQLQIKHGTSIPKWFADCISEFEKYDEKSTTFRYSDEGVSADEVMVDLPQLKKVMDIIADSFHRIMIANKKAVK